MLKAILKLFSRDKSRDVVINDPDFGSLTFDGQSWSSSESGFWRRFIVEAPNSGPTEAQRKFVKQLKGNFLGIEAGGREFVYKNQITHIRIDVYLIEIGLDTEVSRGEFAIEYANQHADLIFRVKFVNWQPVHYSEED